MTKTDGIDDKLDPFGASFFGDSGHRILPLGVYQKMLCVLNQYSSVHGLGHFNLRCDRQQHGGGDGVDDNGRRCDGKAVVAASMRKWAYNTMLDTLCKWDEMTAALALFEAMVGEPNQQTLYVLADAMLHPLSIAHFVEHIAPTEWAGSLSNKVRHLQHQSWMNIYKPTGQIVHALSTAERASWVNVQKKYGDLVHRSCNEVFFGYFPRTQFLMAMALNRLEGVAAVLNESASEWLDNLIQCYTVQYLPDYKHIFKGDVLSILSVVRLRELVHCGIERLCIFLYIHYLQPFESNEHAQSDTLKMWTDNIFPKNEVLELDSTRNVDNCVVVSASADIENGDYRTNLRQQKLSLCSKQCGLTRTVRSDWARWGCFRSTRSRNVCH